MFSVLRMSPAPSFLRRRDTLGRDGETLRVHHVLHALAHRLGTERRRGNACIDQSAGITLLT